MPRRRQSHLDFANVDLRRRSDGFDAPGGASRNKRRVQRRRPAQSNVTPSLHSGSASLHRPQYATSQKLFKLSFGKRVQRPERRREKYPCKDNASRFNFESKPVIQTYVALAKPRRDVPNCEQTLSRVSSA
ncbi:hypothetical protein EVAR_60837_1 [Eumeta japonica]|uniref:Uncharacterized protein n=1 Tax=Eumeta variegata TaxID=151549 RepID=A0A4C1Y8T7_EUMVA|nr:hypothetical protein EVAR_60837_1 [Eumeta japonica]